MSTRIILVRHAETPGSLERRFTGATDVHLTDEGLQQAEALGRRLKEVHIDAIYVSPLSRCRQTADKFIRYVMENPHGEDNNCQGAGAG